MGSYPLPPAPVKGPLAPQNPRWDPSGRPHGSAARLPSGHDGIGLGWGHDPDSRRRIGSCPRKTRLHIRSAASARWMAPPQSVQVLESPCSRRGRRSYLHFGPHRRTRVALERGGVDSPPVPQAKPGTTGFCPSGPPRSTGGAHGASPHTWGPARVCQSEKFGIERDLTHFALCWCLPGGKLLTKGAILNRDGVGRVFYAMANPVTSDGMAPRRSSSHHIGGASLA
jgi:hypothetical protein